jgi:TnpA family transposase
VVGLAFAELLGFRLLPRLKNIGSTGFTDPTTPARRTASSVPC